MREDLYAEKLAYFKEKERPEVVLLIADEPQLIKIVVAWTNTTVVRAEKLSPLRSDTESEVWEWLWKNTVYSRDQLIARSAILGFGFESKMARLIGNRALYPDGSVNSFVQRYLRDRVLRLFEGKPKNPTRKS